MSGYAALTAGILGIGITTSVLVHALGTATFGLWITLSTVVAYAGLADGGFTHAVSRFTGEFRARGDARALGEFLGIACLLYGSILVAVLAGAAFAGAGLSLVVRLPATSMHEIQLAILFLAFATGMAIWMGAVLNLLHAYQRLALANLIRAAYWTVYTVLTIVVALVAPGIVGLSIAAAVSGLLGWAASAVVARRVLDGVRLRWPSGQIARRSLSYSVSMFLIVLGGVVLLDTDNPIIALTLGISAVTPYAVAMRLARGLLTFLHRIPDVLFPFYSGMRAVGDTRRLRESFLLTSRLEMAGAGFAALCIVFAGPAFLRWWVGPSNVVAFPVLLLTVVVLVFEAVIHPAAVLATACGGERATARANYIQATLKLMLTVVLVVRFGVVAVVAATAAAQALTNLWWLPRWAMRRASVSAREFWSETGLRILPAFAAGLAIGLVAAALWRGPGDVGAFVAAIGAGVAYAATYLAAGAGPQEREWLRHLMAGPLRRDLVAKG